MGQRKQGSCFSCWGQGAVQTQDEYTQGPAYEDVKAVQKNDAADSKQQAVFLVKMASTSDGLPSPNGIVCSDATPSSTSSSSAATGSDVSEQDLWYDCDNDHEWFDAQDAAAAAAAAAAAQQSHGPGATTTTTGAVSPLTAQQAACLQDLPPRLSNLVEQYLLGSSLGCKPVVAALKYMQDTSTSLVALQALLEPLLAAEQHLPQQVPMPSARHSPAEVTAALRDQHSARQLRQPAHMDGSMDNSGSSSSSSAAGGQQHQPRLAHLLRSLHLAQNTLAVMEQEEGFKQVASGLLQLWYCHDLVRKAQIIRAKVVLSEPVSVIAAVTREVDLVTCWNPGMADMCELAAYSPTELLVYFLLWMPWPLHMPEVINYCFGLDMLDLQEQCVLFHMSSTPLPEGVTAPNHPRTIPLHLDVGGFRLVPLPPSPDAPDTPRTEVTVLVSIDAARFVVPDSIISFVLKVFAPLVHRNVLGIFKRMFHKTTPTAGGGSMSSSSGATAAAASRVPSHSAVSAGPSRSGVSTTTCSSGMLLERLALRPEYAALDRHAAQVLSAKAAAATAGSGMTAEPLDLSTPRTTGAGLAA